MPFHFPTVTRWLRGSLFAMGAALMLSRTLGVDLTLDGSRIARTFEGIGAVSAGASSRLLIDYPEPQRSEILDFLFKPGAGASLQHLKVEIGGDVNSTDGTEPSYARVRGEEDFNRGWEWWLIREARLRNPNLVLDALIWGAPGWIGGGTFYSEDMIRYLVRFLDGAKREHGITFQFIGVWNEKPYDITWIKALRRGLDAAGWGSVQIVAADEWEHPWSIIGDLAADPEFDRAVYAVGVHYPHMIGDDPAIASGKRLWASEDGIAGGTGFTPWQSARRIGQILNRNYTNARITKTEIWSPVTAYYDTLPYNDSGLMRANTPWSGHYEVLPAIWATAHTTQFVQPGWRYLDGTACVNLHEGGSVVSLLSPDSNQLTVVVETLDAIVSQPVVLHATNGIPPGPLTVWRTRDGDAFRQIGTLPFEAGGWSFVAEPECLYTLTSTRGQTKTITQPPAATPLGLPFSVSFEEPTFNALPAGFMDQGGAFEVVTEAGTSNHILSQRLNQTGIEWYYPQTQTLTLVGDSDWTDYEVSVRARLPQSGEVTLLGRLGVTPKPPAAPNGFSIAFIAPTNGASPRFELRAPDRTLASGELNLPAHDWHRLRLRFQADTLLAWIDDARVASVTLPTLQSGRVGVGSQWHPAEFDDLTVHRLPRLRFNLARSATASASSIWSDAFAAKLANDGDSESRWNSGLIPAASEWLQLDFPVPVVFNRVSLLQFGTRIDTYSLQAWTNNDWRTIASGTALPRVAEFTFPAVNATKLRLTVPRPAVPVSIHEFMVHAEPETAPTVVISEWMLNNFGALPDPADGHPRPWFELWNRGPLAVDLSGFHVSDDWLSPAKTTLPSGTLLQPGERRVVWLTGESGSTVPAPLHLPLAPQAGGTLGLYSPEAIPVFVVDLDAQPANRSSGIPDAGSDAILQFDAATPGQPNSQPQATGILKATEGTTLRLSFRAAPFTRYALQASDSVAGTNWISAGSAVSDAEGRLEFLADSNSGATRFYQLRAP